VLGVLGALVVLVVLVVRSLLRVLRVGVSQRHRVELHQALQVTCAAQRCRQGCRGLLLRCCSIATSTRSSSSSRCSARRALRSRCLVHALHRVRHDAACCSRRDTSGCSCCRLLLQRLAAWPHASLRCCCSSSRRGHVKHARSCSCLERAAVGDRSSGCCCCCLVGCCCRDHALAHAQQLSQNLLERGPDGHVALPAPVV
jgi:hypothetical protein